MPEFDLIDKDLNKISEIIYVRHNKDISVFDFAYLTKSIDGMLFSKGLKGRSEYCSLLSNDERESVLFLKSLHNTYSRFFRDGLTFSCLEQSILPSLAAKKNCGEIRVWSACCAAGQEAYSLAMLINHLSVVKSLPIRCRILATDISEDALKAAKEAVYDESAVSNVRLCHLKKYFVTLNNVYTVTSSLKDNIEFALYDLLDSSTSYPPESIYGNFDIVMCSNLLLYYRPEIRNRIILKLTNSLSDDGYLIAGETEKAFFINPMLCNPPNVPENIFINPRGRLIR